MNQFCMHSVVIKHPSHMLGRRRWTPLVWHTFQSTQLSVAQKIFQLGKYQIIRIRLLMICYRYEPDIRLYILVVFHIRHQETSLFCASLVVIKIKTTIVLKYKVKTELSVFLFLFYSNKKPDIRFTVVYIIRIISGQPTIQQNHYPVHL